MKSDLSASYSPLNFSLEKLALTAEATFGSNALLRQSGVKYTSFTKAHSDMNSFLHWVESI